MTGYLEGLVARGSGLAARPALAPRLAPEIVTGAWRQPALPPVEPAPEEVPDVAPARRAPPSRRKPVADAPAVRRADPEPRPDPRRVAERTTHLRSRAAEPAPERHDAPTADAGPAPIAATSPIAPASARTEAPHGDFGSTPSPPPAGGHRRVRDREARPGGASTATLEPGQIVPNPASAGRPATRPVAELVPREPEERRELPSVPAAPRIEVRIGRVEVRAPRAPEPWRPDEAAPAEPQAAANPFAGLAAARRYVDRAWR